MIGLGLLLAQDFMGLWINSKSWVISSWVAGSLLLVNPREELPDLLSFHGC